MIIFVDNEHPDAYQRPWGERLLAARTRIKYRLEDITGDHCLMVRYHRLTPALMEQMAARALFISGNSANPPDYEPSEQAGLMAVLREERYPTFGFCGGFQTMAAAYGMEVAPIGPLDADESDPFPEMAPGMKKEHGYAPVTITAVHPLVAGLGEQPIFRQAHSWEIKTVAPEFDLIAKTAVSPIQLLVHRERPIIGTQFHPEYYTDEYPAGRLLIENFCRLAGLIP